MEVDETVKNESPIQSSSSLPEPEEKPVETSAATIEIKVDEKCIENGEEGEKQEEQQHEIEKIDNKPVVEEEEKLNVVNETKVELEKPNESMVSSSSEENMETAPESEVDQSDTSVTIAASKVETPAKPSVSLFANVRYHILNSKVADVESQLDANGAYKEPYLGSFVTHVVCDDPDASSDYSEAKEVFELPIVNSEWVFMCIKTNSLLP